jgi:hypothetical protein
MGETISLKSGDRDECSGERLLFGFDGGDFLDLAAGRYPEKPLEKLRGRNSLDRFVTG